MAWNTLLIKDFWFVLFPQKTQTSYLTEMLFENARQKCDLDLLTSNLIVSIGNYSDIFLTFKTAYEEIVSKSEEYLEISKKRRMEVGKSLVEFGEIDDLKWAVANKVAHVSHCGYHKLLESAAKYGRLTMFKFLETKELIKQKNLDKDINPNLKSSVIAAIRRYQIDMLEYLLPKCDPAILTDDKIVRYGLESDCWKILHLLERFMPVSKHKHEEGYVCNVCNPIKKKWCRAIEKEKGKRKRLIRTVCQYKSTGYAFDGVCYPYNYGPDYFSDSLIIKPPRYATKDEIRCPCGYSVCNNVGFTFPGILERNFHSFRWIIARLNLEELSLQTFFKKYFNADYTNMFHVLYVQINYSYYFNAFPDKKILSLTLARDCVLFCLSRWDDEKYRNFLDKFLRSHISLVYLFGNLLKRRYVFTAYQLGKKYHMGYRMFDDLLDRNIDLRFSPLLEVTTHICDIIQRYHHML